MKTSMWILLGLGFLLATLSPITAQDESFDSPDDDTKGDDDEEILLADDDTAITDDGTDYDDDSDNTLDIRSEDDLEELFLDDYSDEHDENDKRWAYKCNYEECNNRCQKLLKLKSGDCNRNGKCYCRRGQ